ncbi:MAG: hypothetical protein Q8T08_20500, partial [Ignavibacteria bacterium]|nr:hypothetical protein [Ignavibacteria bacterium]
EKKKREIETEKSIFELNEKIFGEFTAICIKEKQVKIGMWDEALPLILGTPKKINTTETANGISRQYVYYKMYIYSVNGKVTTIQREE